MIIKSNGGSASKWTKNQIPSNLAVNSDRGMSKIRAFLAHYRRIYDDLEAIFSKLGPYLPGKLRSRY
jgi:3-methyladenine DNA glycosylase/8-oxoguanine DNA glycosylase